MPTKLLRHIKNTLPDLRKSEKIVGEFILADPKSIITMKTAEASSAMGISEPTLIRFCKALGFTGYQELKINLSQQLAADDYFVMYEIDQNDTIHELCEKVFDTTISEILNVRSQIDQNVLSDAIEILANAGRVEFYAFGGSAPVAMDGQHKFFRLKIPSSYISDPHIQFMSANSLGKDDVVVILISKQDEGLSGTAIAASLDGMRPLMVEIQALVSTAVYGTPQRSTTGYNAKRLNMLLAVLEKRAGFHLGAKDVFLNITGGISIEDPAIDLAVIGAILSSNQDHPIDRSFCFAAEVGLAGEIRPVQRVDQRITEAAKLGFEHIIVSKHNKISAKPAGIKIIGLGRVEEMVELLFS